MPIAVSGDGTRINYDCFGALDGPPLVLIMGMGVDRWGWLRQRPFLARKFRCIVLDNRGSGLSDKPPGPYDIFGLADDVLAVLDNEEIESAHVVGMSLGGVVAQVLAIAHPRRVRSLVLASTACRVKDWRRELLSEWIELAESHGTNAFARENLRWVVSARHLRWLLPITPLFAPLVVRAPRVGIIGQIEAIIGIEEQVYQLLENIDVPTTVIVGSQDVLTPVADSEEIASYIPNASLHVIAGAAHGLVVTKAKTFNRLIGEFYDEVGDLGAPMTARASRKR